MTEFVECMVRRCSKNAMNLLGNDESVERTLYSVRFE